MCSGNKVKKLHENYLNKIFVLQVLELVCTRESGAVFEAGGLNCVLTFICEHGSQVHKDTLHSCMTVVSRLCGKMEPKDSAQQDCVSHLSALLDHDDHFVSDGALRCFASLADRFSRRGEDPAPLAANGLIDVLLQRLCQAGETGISGIMVIPFCKIIYHFISYIFLGPSGIIGIKNFVIWVHW